ncbi:MAG: putative transport system permease protein, partial [Actinomycetota bacterium]|nr:putative transport system permease protein [Actinomycetota bacterium]
MTGLGVVLRFVNLRHFRSHKMRTGLTAAGIAAGVALVFSISVINGTLISSARASVRDLAGAAEIEVAAADSTGLSTATVQTVEDVAGVERAIPVLRVTTKFTGAEGTRRALVLGVGPDFAQLFPGGLDPGELRVSGGVGSGGAGLVLSETLARRLGSPIGDIVAAETPGGAAPLTVTGTIGGGPVSTLNGGDLGVMLLPAAQSAFERRDRVDSVYVIVDPRADIGDVTRAIDETLKGAAIVGPPGERGRGFDDTFGALSTLTSLAGLVALFVAMFVVYNTMSMSLAERRREISMVQAFGAPPKAVAGAFLAEAALLGVLASAAGILLGGVLAKLLVGAAVTQYSILPLTSVGGLIVAPGQVAVAGVGGVAVALLGALLPALRVLHVAPIESLRPEASYEWVPADASRRRSKRVPAAVAGLALSLVLLALFARSPQTKQLAIAGLLAGLTGVTLILPAVVPAAVRIVAPLIRRTLGTVGRLAVDALLKNPGRTTYTIGALVLTLGMVVSVGAALGSYEDEIETQAESTFAAPLFVGAESFTGLGSDQPLPGSFETAIESIDGVAAAYAQRYVSVDIEGQQALLYALPTIEAERAGNGERFAGASEDAETLIEGLAEGGVVVSRLTAKRHGLVNGGSFVIPTPVGERSFRVVGTFPDLASFDSMYIDRGTYRRFWEDDKADRFAVMLSPGSDEAKVTEGLRRAIAEAGIPAEVLTKQALIDRILSAIKGLFSIARGIQIAALLIAVLTIANTMFTAVFERRWESGLSRALGMSARQLRRSVVIEAALIGLIGSAGAALLGLILGYVMTQIM